MAGIGPGPAARWCSPTWAPRWCASYARAGPVRGFARPAFCSPAAPQHLRRPQAPRGVDPVLRMCERADGLFEGFRPGMMERLGLGPDICLARDPSLVYGRISGLGQDGPLAQAAGHDINYIALAGVLAHIGAPASRRRRRSTWSATSAAAAFCSRRNGLRAARAHALGQGPGRRRGDGRRRRALMTILGGAQQRASGATRPAPTCSTAARPSTTLRPPTAGTSRSARSSRSSTPSCSRSSACRRSAARRRTRGRLAGPARALRPLFRTRARDEWSEVFEAATPAHPGARDVGGAGQPHTRARGALVEVAGVAQPRPAPRFSRTDRGCRARRRDGADADEVLREWGSKKERCAQSARHQGDQPFFFFFFFFFFF